MTEELGRIGSSGALVNFTGVVDPAGVHFHGTEDVESAARGGQRPGSDGSRAVCFYC